MLLEKCNKLVNIMFLGGMVRFKMMHDLCKILKPFEYICYK